MSIYEELGSRLGRRAGPFVGVVALVTVLMLLSMSAIPAAEEASGDPKGPAFEARKLIGDEFPSTAHSIPFIVEAKDDDVLTKEVLAEFHASLQAFRASDIYEDYQLHGFDVDRNEPVVSIFTISDGVEGVLAGSFNTTLAEASPDLVKVALHFFFASSSGLLGTLSTDNSSEVRDITVGPMVFEDVVVWRSKAFINAVALDIKEVEANLTEVLDVEAMNLDVVDMLEGDERSYNLYGIAVDLNTEIMNEATTSIVLVVIAVIAILVVVAINLRSGRETMLVGAGVLMLLLWIFGSVRLIGLGSSQFIDLLLPIAILSLGVDYAIHSLHRLHEEQRHEAEPRTAYRRSVELVGPALMIAMITTAVAFMSNASSELQTVQQFGIAAGLAIVWAYVILGLWLPAVRMLPQQRRFEKGSGSGAEGSPVREGPAEAPEGKATGGAPRKGPSRMSRTVTRLAMKPLAVLVVVILVTVPLAYRGWNIEGKMPVEDYINAKSEFVVSLEKMNDYFIAGESGKVLVQADFSDPRLLAAIATYKQNLRDNDEALDVGGLSTIYDYVKNLTANDFVFPMYGNSTLRDHLGVTDADGDGVPDASDMLDRVYGFMLGDGQGLPVYSVDGEVVRHQPLDIESLFMWNRGQGLDLVLLTVQLPHSGDASKVAEAREELKADLAHLNGLGLEYGRVSDGPYYVITDVGTYNPFTREEQMTALTNSMAISIFTSLVLCLGVMVVLFRSVKFGLVAIVPMLLVVAWLYGFMEVTGHYLNSVTVTIAAISIGVGVDYSIHVTQRFREELEKDGEFEGAMLRTMDSTGKALVGSAGSTFIGFLIIGLSPMTMFSKFGYLTAIMIGMAFVSAVLVLPSLLSLLAPRRPRPPEAG